MNSAAVHRLVIHPSDPETVPDSISDIQQAMADIGLIGPALENNDNFQIGNEFLNLVTFMGCAPGIKLSPEDGDDFCRIVFTPAQAQSGCLGYTTLVVPQCPSCKTKIRDWHDASGSYTCTNCDSETPLHQFRWRKQAGFGRYCFYITQIHLQEVIPSAKILQTLKETSGFDWTYFFANNSSD